MSDTPDTQEAQPDRTEVLPAKVIQFALNPAGAIPGLIDFTLQSHLRMHRRATSKLSDDTFDCVPEDLYQFLKELGDRASEFRWNDAIGILMIPKYAPDSNAPIRHVNLLSNHGELTMEEIHKFELTYVEGNSRSAQDCNMLYTCLMSSLSKAGKSKVVIWEDQYTINGIKSGNLLLKTIIRESHLDSNATTTSICTQLSSLDIYVTTINSNVTKFNAHVQLLLNGLQTRGETTQDLLTNLLKGYLAVSDHSFVKYIQRKQEDYEDGAILEPRKLMMLADNKYKNLLVKGTWNAPSANEEKILALETQLESFKRKKGPRQDQEDLRKKRPKSSSTYLPDPDWLKNHIKPKEGDPLTKKHKGKKWHFCSTKTGGKCNDRWTVHAPSECRGTAPGADRSSQTKAEKNKVKLIQAMQTVLREDSGSESDE